MQRVSGESAQLQIHCQRKSSGSKQTCTDVYLTDSTGCVGHASLQAHRNQSVNTHIQKVTGEAFILFPLTIYFSRRT